MMDAISTEAAVRIEAHPNPDLRLLVAYASGLRASWTRSQRKACLQLVRGYRRQADFDIREHTMTAGSSGACQSGPTG